MDCIFSRQDIECSYEISIGKIGLNLKDQRQQNKDKEKESSIDLMEMIPLVYQISEDKWKEKIGTHLNLTCSKSPKQVEFKWNKQKLYQALQLWEEARNQNFRQHQILTDFLGKTICYDNVVIILFVQSSYMCPDINADETKVHKCSKDKKQEQGMIRIIFQNCIQVRDVSAGTRKIITINESKRFRQKYNGKMLVNVFFDKEALIENVVSSDLVKILNQFLQRCDDVQSTRQIEPEVFRRDLEFVRGSAAISGMEKHLDVKLELREYWTSEKYLVQREREKYHYTLEAIWQNIFDLSHCEEHFVHGIEKLPYASSINRDKRLERLSYVYDFSPTYDEIEHHVSLIQGSTENIQAYAMIFPFNASTDSYFDRGSSLTNGCAMSLLPFLSTIKMYYFMGQK